MATIAQKIKCERDARELCANNDLPDPDWVEYGETCIRLFWEATKTVLVIDIDGTEALAESEAVVEAEAAAGLATPDERESE